jgi:threonylcarbamoyladenosine tRNA methylthiotransferase MtaB
MTKTLKTVTLGCKVNQYETEFVRQGFERLGYRKAVEGEPVDLCIVNTCTVTAESEAKCRKIIRRIAKDHPEAEIVVTGCFATRSPDEAAALPGVVEVIANKRELPNLLARRGLVDIPTGIARFDRRRRAYVKVQDGCRMKCSYCIVPMVRPHLTSRPLAEVLDEIRRLLANGHREIVLTGIHLGEYGNEGREERGDGRGEGSTRIFPHTEIQGDSVPLLGTSSASAADRTQHCLCQAVAHHDEERESTVESEGLPPLPSPFSSLTLLLQHIAELDGEFRVRLSSIEAGEVTREMIRLMAARRDRFCPHLHLPLQSGSDAVLLRMNRRWTSGQFVERCREIQAALDRPALTTDVIVGFPGESEADFAETCRVVEEVGFAKVHVFRFSPRQGTPAAEMADQVPGRIAERRARSLGKIGKSLQLRYCQSILGRSLQVMVEMPMASRPGWMGGTSDHHAQVALPGGRELLGRFVSVVGERVENGWIWAGSTAAS